MSLLQELKRRNVFRVGLAYAVVAWLVLQIADVLIDNIGAPDWVFRTLLMVLGIGLPVALLFAWAFEMTPEGIKKEKDVDRSTSIAPQTGRKLDRVIIGVLTLALAYFVLDKFVLKPGATAPVEATTAAASIENPRTLAVLPLVNMSADANNEYFADGLTEELLNILSRISELRVAGRTSSFAFKGKSEDLRVIAEKLNVDTLLEGSVRKDAERVRITLQLINAADGYHLWSQTYDRQLDDIFSIQEEIAHEVADALRVTLLGEDDQLITSNEQTDMTAYELYLQGLAQLNAFSHSSLSAAQESFQQAIAQDPDYQPAKLKLVETWLSRARTGAIRGSEAAQLSAPMLAQMLAKDPKNDQALALTGMVQRFTDADAATRFNSAEQYFQDALNNNARNVLALTEMGSMYTTWGRDSRALELLHEAERIDPYEPDLLFELGRLHAVQRQAEMSETYGDRIGEIQPDSPGQYWVSGMARLVSGDLDLSLYRQVQAHRLDPQDFEYPAGIAGLWIDLGDADRAQHWMDLANEGGADQPLPITSQVRLLQYREQQSQAATLAEQAMLAGMERRAGTGTITRRAYINRLVRAGDYAKALDWYRQLIPGAFTEDPDFELEVPRNAEWYLEAGAVLLLAEPGSDRGLALLDAAEIKTELLSRERDNWGKYLGLANVASARGNAQEALQLLDLAYEKGLRYRWRNHLLENFIFDDLHDEPLFKALIARLEQDMDRQRERAYALLEANP